MKVSARIMIVEDRDMISQAIEDMLTISGYEVVSSVEDGKTAIDTYPSSKPDIVLMDISMPFVDGIETTRVIKRIAPETRVVMLSIHENNYYRADAIQAGALAYVNKREMTTKLIPILQEIITNDQGHLQDRQPKEE